MQQLDLLSQAAFELLQHSLEQVFKRQSCHLDWSESEPGDQLANDCPEK